MQQMKQIIIKSIQGIYEGVKRFPMTVLNLIGIATLLFMWVWSNEGSTLMQEKLCYTFLVGCILGMVAQFACERFRVSISKRGIVYGVALLVLGSYFMLLLPATGIGGFVTIRSLVETFAMGCMVLWLPSYRTDVDFNRVTLTHFKAFFTAVLYASVLALGIAAIITAVDVLLVGVHYDAYSYMLIGVWVLFAPIYYLSLLPDFKGEEETEYPKVLAILVSKIAIPLITIYTLVLIAYFVKILVTLTWPSGQVGPMVLVYVIAGLLIFVLSGMLTNKFAVFYHRFFPKLLIPIVIMQLISVAIRLKSYGVTESRYYVLVFGIFSLVVGVVLSVRKQSNNEWIALFAAVIAVLSIVPPVDAFTLSRKSQVGRIEAMLQNEGMLEGDAIVKKEDVSQEVRVEITDILSYLQRNDYTDRIKWLPEDFSIYEDMQELFGFEPQYDHYSESETWYFSAYLDDKEPLRIAGYDVLLETYIDGYKTQWDIEKKFFELDGITYGLQSSKRTNGEIYLSIIDSDGKVFIEMRLDDFVTGLIEKGHERKAMAQEEMSYAIEKDQYKMKVIIRDMDYSYRSESEQYLGCGLYVLFTDGGE